jgi:hypothetical protein
MTSDRVAVVEIEELSVTLTINREAPIVVAVPYIVPLGLRLRPSGSEPLARDQMYGGDPPVALSACEYAAPTAPGGKAVVVIVRAGELIVSDSDSIKDDDALSVTFSVTLEEPVAVGVPVIVPSTRARPGGSTPLTIDQVYGGDPPVALSG